jgi:hypothetical protein
VLIVSSPFLSVDHDNGLPGTSVPRAAMSTSDEHIERQINEERSVTCVIAGLGASLSEKQPMQLDNKKIAILATNGFEQAELEVPRDKLKAAGATVHIVSLEAGEIKGWDKKDWGRPVKVDKTLNQVSADDYDAVVLPGGQINPDLLRVEPKALAFIKDIFNQKKIVAAVCHAPWLLIETGSPGC